MGDYTNMSAYYDLIMTSGYYDYQKIVDNIVSHGDFDKVLELGCGTGLILQELVTRHPAIPKITGIDLTSAMLNIASERLNPYPNISLQRQNVTQFDLETTYDLAFSYGGVWYFVVDGDNEPFMVSHLPEHEDNRRGIERVAGHVHSGGRLLLGIQGPHYDYQRPIKNGYVYSQKIEPADHGFTKHYYLTDHDQTLMAQTIRYRVYPLDEALELLSDNGFQFDRQTGIGSHFFEFHKT
nr:class I SAM-dependent methyltransferase [Oxalobacteraceae bacterium]